MRTLISAFSTFRGFELADHKNLSNAHKMADSGICLPMHNELSKEDIQSTFGIILNKKQ